jgi:hypothetical protein
MFDAIRKYFRRATAGAVADGPALRSPAESYKDFMIQPAPRKQGSQWLTVGIISKEGADGRREVEFIRSDLFASRGDAEACAFAKGRQIIDEQGDRVFERPTA